MEKNTEDFQEKSKNEEKILLKISKKYSIKYVLTAKLGEIYIVFLFLIILFFTYDKKAMGFFSIVILLLVILFTLIFSKKSASNTYIIFYEDKIYYKRRFLLRNTEKIMHYDDVKTVTFTYGTNWYESIWQKMFNLGNIYIYPKEGNILTRGISMEVVGNLDKVIKDIENIFGDRMK